MDKLILGAQLYTVRELIASKSYEEVYAVLEKIRNIGYKSVQISGIGNVTLELAHTYKKICSKLNLEINATHISYDFLKNHMEWIIEYHKMWNCNYVGIGSMPEEFRSADEARMFALECNQYGKTLSENGLKLIYHNHDFEFEKFDKLTIMDCLYSTFDSRYVQFEIDTYWVQAGGCNPEEWIYKVDNRMDVVHFKDYTMKGSEPRFCEIGEGNLNWNNIIRVCKETAVKYIFVEQDNFTDDPIASLKLSYEFLDDRIY